MVNEQICSCHFSLYIRYKNTGTEIRLRAYFKILKDLLKNLIVITESNLKNNQKNNFRSKFIKQKRSAPVDN